MSATQSSSRGFALRAIAVVLVGLGVLRLNSWLGPFTSNSLQMDFSAFYTAGEALNLGYNPYENNIARSPESWDGASAYRHSRFLYPPLAASLFRPLAHLPYSTAKVIWTGIVLASLLGAVALAHRLSGLKGLDSFLICAAGAASFHPVLCALDRGQIDAITLLLIMVMACALAAQRRPHGVGAGAVLACIVLLKLHAVLLVPFLVWRRRWDALAGLAAGGVLLGAVSLAVNGRAAIEDYLRVQLPRIAAHGENGTPEMLLPESVWRDRISSEGRVVKGGTSYRIEALSFFPNASLVHPIEVAALNAGGSIRVSVVSLSLFACGFVAVALAAGVRARPDPAPRTELLTWLVAMALVLVTAPLTWAMNVVWLIPALPLAMAFGARASDRVTALAVALLVLAFVVAWLPDTRAHALLRPLAILDEGKYIAAELLTILAGTLLLRRSTRPGGPPASLSG